MSRHALSSRLRADDTVQIYLDIDRSRLNLVSDDPRWRVSGFGTQVGVLTVRSLRIAFSDYRLVFFGLLQPIVILLLFSQVFAGIGALPGIAEYSGYLNYLTPATLITIAVITSMSSGAGILAEIYTGFIGRLRTMPINLVAVLVARTLADAVRLTLQLITAVDAAVLFLGFEPAGIAGVVGAIAVSVVVGWGLSWVFVAIATWQTKPELMQAASFVVMFPLMFGSSAYMPVDSMPTWIRVVSTVNPLTYAIDSARALALGTPVGSALAATVALVTCAALIGGAAAARNVRKTAT
ncbi:MAG: ABC transporter permease [Haloechinothrix sp.]